MSSSHAARFIAAAATADRIPAAVLPEVAFAGRSNAGKSSLLNRLTGHGKLARVSKTPGRTQQINFFAVDESFVIADLPGYGFARVPLIVKDQWKLLVEAYLPNRAALSGVIVLVDLRRGLEVEDDQLLAFLAAHYIDAVVVGTKADKLAQGERLRQSRALMEAAARRNLTAVISSATTGQGMTELWAAVVRLLKGRNTTHRRG